MATTETGPGQQLPDDREVLTWDLFGVAVRELAQAVADSGFVPDVVVAVARGGLPPGGALAYALGTKAVGTLNVEFYTGVDERLPDPVVLPPLLDTDALDGLRALVVDDVADTGETLALVQDLMAEHCAEVRTAVLYAKARSVVDPAYVWRRTDRWITFPWSAQPPVTAARRDDDQHALA
ncbi:phosphoribosyltransferase [Cellulomonas sp.]|uniref:phosphoribosyltransferase n=1 Tax=Cellulomonas sp. TaxID=40001 RepID=UPI001B2056D5|nr:phosphoribosyltransferase [Cellulomonas sp.]MBO9553718.1 phosphoribosyltransferase [Cellulomonas sp.]